MLWAMSIALITQYFWYEWRLIDIEFDIAFPTYQSLLVCYIQGLKTDG